MIIPDDFVKVRCNMVTGKLGAYMPDGQEIPGQVSLILTSNCDEDFMHATITLVVDHSKLKQKHPNEP